MAISEYALPEGSVSNLRKFFELARPDELAEAHWYERAHAECKRMAQALGVDFQQFVWAVAALSPNMYWDRNIVAVVELVKHGKTGHGFPHNQVKALEILSGNLEALRGDKVTRFAWNIFQPSKYKHEVVVDKWARRAWHGIVGGDVQGATGTKYERIADDYRHLANEVGLKPSEVQAVIWIVVRRLGKVFNLAGRKRMNNRKQAVRKGNNINAQKVHKDILGKGKPGGDANSKQGTNS